MEAAWRAWESLGRVSKAARKASDVAGRASKVVRGHLGGMRVKNVPGLRIKWTSLRLKWAKLRLKGAYLRIKTPT